MTKTRPNNSLVQIIIYDVDLYLFCKAGWRENQVTFMNELKNLQATGLSTLGTSLKEAFDLLNLYRLHSGIDNYGMVRYVMYVYFAGNELEQCMNGSTGV